MKNIKKIILSFLFLFIPFLLIFGFILSVVFGFYELYLISPHSILEFKNFFYEIFLYIKRFFIFLGGYINNGGLRIIFYLFIVAYFLRFGFGILKIIFKILFFIPKKIIFFFFDLNKVIKVLSVYFFFAYKFSIKNPKFIFSLKNLGKFLMLFNLNELKLKGRKYSDFIVSPEFIKMKSRIENILNSFKDGDVYIRNIDKKSDGSLYFYISYPEFFQLLFTEKVLIEIDRVLGNINGKKYNIEKRLTHDSALLIANRKINIQTKDFDLNEIVIPKNKGILGNSKTGTVLFDLRKDLIHSIIIASTRSGKDILAYNIILSLIYQIKNFHNFEIIYFDVKGSDGLVFKNLNEINPDLNNYIERVGINDEELILSKMYDLKNEVTERFKKIGIHSNLNDYSKNTGDYSLKHKYIFINELMSLFAKVHKKTEKELGSILVSLISESAGAGFHFVMITQTSRADVSDFMGKILANTDSRFIGKLSNKNEILVQSGKDEEVAEKIRNISDYHFLWMKSGVLQGDQFKTNYISQKNLLEFIKS